MPPSSEIYCEKAPDLPQLALDQLCQTHPLNSRKLIGKCDPPNLAVIRVVKSTSVNHGRFYLGCPKFSNRQSESGCRFFSWYDGLDRLPPSPPPPLNAKQATREPQNQHRSSLAEPPSPLLHSLRSRARKRLAMQQPQDPDLSIGSDPASYPRVSTPSSVRFSQKRRRTMQQPAPLSPPPVAILNPSTPPAPARSGVMVGPGGLPTPWRSALPYRDQPPFDLDNPPLSPKTPTRSNGPTHAPLGVSFCPPLPGGWYSSTSSSPLSSTTTSPTSSLSQLFSQPLSQSFSQPSSQPSSQLFSQPSSQSFSKLCLPPSQRSSPPSVSQSASQVPQLLPQPPRLLSPPTPPAFVPSDSSNVEAEVMAILVAHPIDEVTRESLHAAFTRHANRFRATIASRDRLREIIHRRPTLVAALENECTQLRDVENRLRAVIDGMS